MFGSNGIVLGALSFMASAVGIGIYVSDVRLEWKDKCENQKWRIKKTFNVVLLTLASIGLGYITIASAVDSTGLHEQVDSQAATIEGQRTSLERAQSAVTSADRQINDLQVKTQKLDSKTKALSLEWGQALANAGAASLQAGRIMSEVLRLNRDTLAKLSKTEATAEQAAAKAGVYRVPKAVAAQVTDALAGEPLGRASVACSPGLETACGDLAKLFSDAKWQVQTSLGASFYGGGVFDAPVSNNGPTGVYVWYGPGRQSLASKLVDALSGIGVHVQYKAFPRSSSQSPLDISVNVIFVSK